MTLTLLPQDEPTVIMAFGLGSPDLLVSEAHESSVSVTSHPVERGFNITDHIRVEAKTLSFEVFVTNTPITRDVNLNRGDITGVQLDFPRYQPPFDGTPGALFRKAKELGGFLVDQITGQQTPTTREIQVLSFPDLFDRVREVQEQLIKYQEKGALFSVVTASRTYDDMVITRVGLPRDQPGGGTLQVDMTGIRTVDTATVKAPKPLEKRGAPKQAKGSQGVKPKDAVKSTSLALKAIKAVTGG